MATALVLAVRSAGTSPRGGQSASPARRTGRRPLALDIPKSPTLASAVVTPSPLASTLLPSVAPTPRAAVADDVPVRTPQLRPGQILAPSAGTTNNAARVRNGGQRIVPKLGPRLASSASEPSLCRTGSLLIAGVSEGLGSPQSAKTPRTLRGTVRKASKISMNYPSVPVSPINSPTMLRSRSAASLRPKSAGSVSTRTPTSAKRVSFADERQSPASRDEQALRDFGLRRSMNLLNSLYSLRRSGWDRSGEAADGEEGQGAPVEPDEPLMNATLKDTDDTEESLRKTQEMLQQAHEPVHDFGGCRHATSVISGRTLAVVRRKAELVRSCEARIAAFERADARRDEILTELTSGAAPPPQELVGVNKFLQAHIHSGPPEEANKSDFGAFSTSFGLPAGHHLLRRLHQLGSLATDWWAQATMREAQAGTDTTAVNRLIELAVAILGDREHEAIVQCKTLLGDTLAENALKSARKIQEKDSELVARSDKPQPESARQASDAINAEIRIAVSMGAPSCHSSLEQTKAIATAFAFEEKNRLAGRVLHHAKQAKDRDAAAAARCEGVPPVGPASLAADTVEREAKAMMNKGVSETHPLLKEALSIAKALRDEDGQRKRMAAREKRLNQAAAAGGGATG